MSALLDTLLDPGRLAECVDNDIREARDDARRVAPFWMFGDRTPVQLLIRHPAHHVRQPIRRRERRDQPPGETTT